MHAKRVGDFLAGDKASRAIMLAECGMKAPILMPKDDWVAAAP